MNENQRQTSSAVAQCPVCNELLGAQEGESSNSKRVLVRITSRRSKLLDEDNICPKYFVDCLRYAGFITDDNPGEIKLVVRQEKVKKAEEETVIEVI